MNTAWFVIYIYGAIALAAALGYGLYNLSKDLEEAESDIEALIDENDYLRKLIITLDTVSMN